MNSLVTSIKSIPSKLAVLLVRCYQIALSPLFPSSCRFEPTCSCYAIEAFKKHGFTKGMVLTVKRLIRCRPGGACGYDPVP